MDCRNVQVGSVARERLVGLVVQQASLSWRSVQEDMQQVVESPMSRRLRRCEKPSLINSFSSRWSLVCLVLTPLLLLRCRCWSKSTSSSSIRLELLALPWSPLLQMIPSMWINWSPHSFTWRGHFSTAQKSRKYVSLSLFSLSLSLFPFFSFSLSPSSPSSLSTQKLNTYFEIDCKHE